MTGAREVAPFRLNIGYFGRPAFLTQMFDWTNGCIAVTNAEMDENPGHGSDNTAIVTTP